MADITLEMGTPICWADTTDYNSTNSGITRTHQLDLTSLADGAARQGAKADLGTNRAPSYAVKACIEMAAAPTARTVIEFYWSSSFSATAGTGNDGGSSVTGADAAWAPGGGAEADIDEFKLQLQMIGILSLSADAQPTYQVAMINPDFAPATRYGQPIIKNDGGWAFDADAIQMYVALIPIVPDAAAA